MASATWNCSHLGASSVYSIQPCTMSLHAKPHEGWMEWREAGGVDGVRRGGWVMRGGWSNKGQEGWMEERGGWSDEGQEGWMEWWGPRGVDGVMRAKRGWMEWRGPRRVDGVTRAKRGGWSDEGQEGWIEWWGAKGVNGCGEEHNTPHVVV